MVRSPRAVQRYEVRWTALDPTDGADIAKTRRAVIVTLDELNERLPTVTVCLLTSQPHPGWRTRLAVRIGRRNAEVAVDQSRMVGKARLGTLLGTPTESEARALRRLVSETDGE